MHRSGSYLTMGGGGGGARSSSLALDVDQLPLYDPSSDAAKKEAAQSRLAERAIHLIPLVIVLCFAVLLFFSSAEIEMPSKDESIIARIKNKSIDGYSNWNGTSMTIMEDVDPIEAIGSYGNENRVSDPDSQGTG
ncbi:hypothetical protein ACMD2_01512 [Ananas comosus]|nr:hypothetical protein ACMD2_01512 [Ananas comosus]